MKNLIFIFIIFASTQVFSQETNPLIQELEQQLSSATEDTMKITFLYRIGEAYEVSDLNKAMQYADRGLVKAEKIKWKRGIAALHLLKGNIYSNKGHIDEALKHYQVALKTSKERKDSKAIASALNDIAGLYLNSNNYTKALSYYNECLEVGEKQKNNDLLGLANMGIGNVFFAQEDYHKAMSYFQKALQNFKKTANAIKITAAHELIGLTYHYLQDKKNALLHYHYALDFYQKNNNLDGVASIYSFLGEANNDNQNIAMQYRLKAQEIWDEINPTKLESVYNLGNIGYDYFEMVKNDSAKNLSKNEREEYLNSAETFTNRSIRYAQQNNMGDAESHYLLNLSEIQQARGKYKEALENIVKGQKLKDSIYSQENKNKIAQIESQRALEIKDQQIQINQLALKNAQNTKWALMGGISLFAVIGGMLYHQNRTRRKNNRKLQTLNTELEKANQIKTKFFGILSHDLRSPIAKLVGFLHLQKEMPEAISNPQEHQEKLSNSAESLLENMETILLWSKSQMEHFEPHIKEIPVSRLFNSLSAQLQTYDEIEFSFHNPQNIFINTDENYLLTIMQNLSVNAAKALANTENPKIEWTAKKENNITEFVIKDNGPGMEESKIKALFDENATVKTANGLGFHIIRDLAKKISCHITYQSVINNGTEFKIIFGS